MDDFQLEQIKQDLHKGVRGDVSFDEYMLGVYATDSSIYQIKPIAVVLPLDEQDVIAAVKTAGKYNISILPRGAGTSLGGQAAGNAMVIDFSKYMNRLLEISVKEKWVRVQPGLVLDELNALLKPYGLHFAPDPATSSRATIGGMIGNNSSGSKSIIYGITRDHVLETRTLLSDGTVLDFKEFEVSEYSGRVRKDGDRKQQLFNRFREIIEENHEEILKAFPKIMRRVQGYNLDSFTGSGKWNFSHLMAGSEGTLGLVLSAKLNLEPLPRHKILSAVHFTSLQDCIRSVAPILKHSPSAVEILDEDLVILARKNAGIAPLCGWMEGDPKGILVVEFFGDSEEEVIAKAQALVIDLKKQNTGYAWPILQKPTDQANVWAVRKNGLGLMTNIKGERKPIAFIEDAAVPLEHLPEYIDEILSFCKNREVPVVMYAHASVGLIHVKPLLNLKEQEDIDHMKAIARHSFELIKKFGGSISGEHGDGRTRSHFLEEYFGQKIYSAFREVKNLFDPMGIMNPGIILDPDPMDKNLRYSSGYKIPEIPTEYKYRDEGSFAAAVEQCNGVGACRQNLSGLMCPSYRATRDEEHSTRGRANALRLAISGQMGSQGMDSPALFEIMDLCLSCKGCKTECPSNVDMAKLKGEFLQKHREKHGATLRDRFVSGSTLMAKWFSGWTAPMINWVQKTMLFRKTLEWMVGVDSRRILPSYAPKKFHRWFMQRSKTARSKPVVSSVSSPDIRSGSNPEGIPLKKVVLFDDTYMNYHETNVGISAVELLESCGYEVILAKAGCCQRPGISHGFLKKAKRKGEKTLLNLKKYIDDGLQVVVCEPGCGSALTDDLPDLIDNQELGESIRKNVMMIDVFLEKEIKDGKIETGFISGFEKLMIHGHCHQKSLWGTTAMERVLSLVAGLEVKLLDTGCCGMAGSFGYEKEHYDLSMKVGEDRLFPAIRAKEEETGIVACGFSCRHQIADATGNKARHWVEVLRGTPRH